MFSSQPGSGRITTICIICLVFFTYRLSAQTERGKVILGGAFNLSLAKAAEESAKASKKFSLVPSFGVFLEQDFAVGSALGFSRNRFQDGSREHNFIVRPFSRYYKSMGKQFLFFGEFATPLAFGRFKDADGNFDGASTSIGFSVSPGFTWFVGRKFGVELLFDGAAYVYTKRTDKDRKEIKDASVNEFSIAADFFAPRLGLQLYF